MKKEYLRYKDMLESGLIEKHNDFHYRQIETPRPNRGRCVYVLCGYFPGYSKPIKKIGIANDPLGRYRTIVKDCPYPVFVDYIFRVAWPDSIEKFLHSEFRGNRIRNEFCKSGETEWFVGVNDADILTEFLSFDYNHKAKRQGYSKVDKVDYSLNFKPNLFNTRGEQVRFSELVAKIEIESYSDEIDLLLTSVEIMYSEAERENDLALLRGLISTYEVLEGKAKEETLIIIKGLQAALSFA